MVVTNQMFDDCKKWFQDYISTFDLKDEKRFAFNLKVKHTYDVVSTMQKIIKDMNFDMSDYNLALIIALFHDVGRFNQIKLFGHFNDKNSINHAEESVRVLKASDALNDFDDETKEIIYASIFNHNLYHISEDVIDERTLTFCKLIRDADKVDIYRVLCVKLKEASDSELDITYNSLEKDGRVSKEYYRLYINGEEVPRIKMITIGDLMLGQLVWIKEDINFKSTYQIMKDEKVIDNFYNSFVERFNVSDDINLKSVYEDMCKIIEYRAAN